MAYIVPSDLSRLALSGASEYELKTLQLLKSELPNDYTVFHGVHWSREYEARAQFGEIDFVILNRSGRLLFIEQKNGKLKETGAGLFKTYRDSEKNVVQQVHRSMGKMREKFNWQHGKKPGLEVDCLIYCPDYKVLNVNAAGLNIERVVDAVEKDGLAGRIQTILGPGEATRDGWYEKVEEFFCQTFNLVPDIHAHIDSQEKQYVRQGGALADILTNLQMEPFRLRISGTAGCGKTLFARRFLNREVSAGRNVLQVCYNRPLADKIRDSVGGTGTVNTFFGFCDEFLQSLGQRLDYSLMETDPEFWHRVQEQVLAQEIDDKRKYDALIVDEGQDFEQDWFETLRLFLRKDASILWLEDADQNLQEKPTVSLEGFVRYSSALNYRSPESIADFINNTMPFTFEQGNHLPGMGVEVHGYTDAEEQPKIVGKLVQQLKRKGFSYDDMVVITCRGAQGSIFSKVDKVGGLCLRQFTGKYGEDGQQIMSDGPLAFESIRRFKGQEAPVVILVDVDPDAGKYTQADRLLYCGMTRATVRLELVVSSENDYNDRFLAA